MFLALVAYSFAEANEMPLKKFDLLGLPDLLFHYTIFS